MTDVSNLDDLARKIATSSPNIRRYAIAQAAATQAQELDVRALWEEIELLKGAGSGSRPGSTAPVNTGSPSISGTAQVGQTLTASTGTWSNTPTAYAYRWQRGTPGLYVDIPGATGSVHVLTDAEEGLTVRLVVTAQNSGGETSATSPATGTVTSGDLGALLPARLPTSSQTGQYYVNGSTGSDTTGDGSVGSPWQTPTKAANSVSTPGAVILVTGTYTGNQQLLIQNKNHSGATTNPITFKAASAGAWVITKPTSATGVFQGVSIENSSGYRIEGLKISKFLGNDGGTGEVNNGLGATGVFIENSQWVEFLRCTFEDIGGHVFQIRGAGNDPCTDIWVYGCRFQPTGTTNVSYDGSASADYFAGCDSGSNYYRTRGTHGIYCGQAGGGGAAGAERNGDERVVIANCVFTGKTPGVCVNPHPQARETYIVNNTFYGNDNAYYTLGTQNAGWAAGCGVIFGNDGDSGTYNTRDVHVINNVFSTLKGHAVRCDGSSMATRNNLVYNNLAYNTDNADGNQGRVTEAFEELWNGNTMFAETGGQIATDSDPLFVSPARSSAGDFNLQVGSPALDVADPDYCPSDDIDGNSRPSTPNLGAHE